MSSPGVPGCRIHSGGARWEGKGSGRIGEGRECLDSGLGRRGLPVVRRGAGVLAAFFFLSVSLGVGLFGVGEAVAGVQTLDGVVLLQGQTDHLGTLITLESLQPPSPLPAWSLDWLFWCVAAVVLAVALRRRKGRWVAALLLVVAVVALGAALQGTSDSAGAYRLVPAGGEFEAGTYRLDFFHDGYIRETRFVVLEEAAGSSLSLSTVVLEPLVAIEGEETVPPPSQVPGLGINARRDTHQRNDAERRT